jgi:hypothetical protein
MLRGGGKAEPPRERVAGAVVERQYYAPVVACELGVATLANCVPQGL